MADPKKAGEEADRMIAELNRQAQEAGENQPTAETEVVIPEGEHAKPIDVSAQPETPQVSPSEIEALRKQVEIANQQWRVLQGMIDKKDVELEQMRELMGKITTNEKPATAPATPQSVTAAEIDEYGQELINLITRIAQQEAGKQVGPTTQKLGDLEKSVKGVSEYSQKTAADLFDESLAKRVPDWKEVNVDPAFMAWLQAVDDFSGQTRLAMLNNAYQRMDLERTSKFFEAYKAVGTPAPAAPAKKPIPVSPGKSRSGSSPQMVDDKIIWKPSDITKLYADNQAGRIAKEEFDRLERDLFKAQAEGRLAA